MLLTLPLSCCFASALLLLCFCLDRQTVGISALSVCQDKVAWQKNTVPACHALYSVIHVRNKRKTGIKEYSACYVKNTDRNKRTRGQIKAATGQSRTGQTTGQAAWQKNTVPVMHCILLFLSGIKDRQE